MTFNTTPNMLTLLRILVVPGVVAMQFMREPFWDIAAALLFTAASITDYFDGYLARTRKQVTVYGKLMDPLADKFLVVSAIILLEHVGRIHPSAVILLICRELAITGLRAMASAEGLIIAANDSAKLKTATQMVGIPLLMADDALWGLPLGTLGLALIYVSLALSLWSAKEYVVGFFKALAENQKRRNTERRIAREARKQARARRMAARLNRTSNDPSR